MRNLTTILILNIFIGTSFGQDKNHDLILETDGDFIPYHFIRSIEINSNDTIIKRTNIEPFLKYIRFSDLKAQSFEVKVFTYFNDSLIQNVVLSKKETRIKLPPLYSEIPSEDMINNIINKKEFNIYRYFVHKVSFEATGYTLKYGYVNIQNTTGYYYIRNYDFMGDFGNDSIMTVKPEKEMIDLVIDYIHSNCTDNLSNHKSKRKNQERYPNTIIELDNKILILLDCEDRMKMFNSIDKYLIDNKTKLYEY
jgi:hypothetical protein